MMTMFREGGPSFCATDKSELQPGEFRALPVYRQGASVGFVALHHGVSPFADEPRGTFDDRDRAALEQAYLRGFDEGKAAQSQLMDAESVIHTALKLRLGQIDDQLNDQLAERLRDFALHICETHFESMAVDPAHLEKRIRHALSMLSRATDKPKLFIHPDDLDTVQAFLPEGVPVDADPSLERGAIRLVAATGGVDDGPAQWRKLVQEALALC